MAYKRSAPNPIRILATTYRVSPETIPIPGVYLILDGSGTILYIGETEDINRTMNQFVTNQQHPIWTSGAKTVQYERIESDQERRAQKRALIGAHSPKCSTSESSAGVVDQQRSIIDPGAQFPTFSEFYAYRDLDALERASDLIGKASELALPLAPQLEDQIQVLRGAIDDVIQAERDYGDALLREYTRKMVAEDARRMASGKSPLRFKVGREEGGGEEGCPYCGNPY